MFFLFTPSALDKYISCYKTCLAENCEHGHLSQSGSMCISKRCLLGVLFHSFLLKKILTFLLVIVLSKFLYSA